MYFSMKQDTNNSDYPTWVKCKPVMYGMVMEHKTGTGTLTCLLVQNTFSAIILKYTGMLINYMVIYAHTPNLKWHRADKN